MASICVSAKISSLTTQLLSILESDEERVLGFEIWNMVVFGSGLSEYVVACIPSTCYNFCSKHTSWGQTLQQNLAGSFLESWTKLEISSKSSPMPV